MKPPGPFFCLLPYHNDNTTAVHCLHVELWPEINNSGKHGWGIFFFHLFCCCFSSFSKKRCICLDDLFRLYWLVLTLIYCPLLHSHEFVGPCSKKVNFTTTTTTTTTATATATTTTATATTTTTTANAFTTTTATTAVTTVTSTTTTVEGVLYNTELLKCPHAGGARQTRQVLPEITRYLLC